MKLQIEGQKLRVRVDEDELAQLLARQTVEARTQFADAFAIGFAFRLTSDAEATFAGQAEAWQIGLPEATVREHAARLPTREGLRFTLVGKGGDEALELLFDVDVRDSVKRRRSFYSPHEPS
ncbi:hypothetical protein IMW82_14475 [Rhodanobacter sp. B2A1Ga4]|uniref:DUF7009 family protein n=1 Tax=Rhodanobacter sp. B2A1Ga4 TaxID=2778647 RepID=UPI001B36EA13|nr:hypothetical protein [Rhodanobacter sp. B2A1Ga4]MBQ4855875.1 hypothetical protein [Rhodanobacter sp. B2A1Ga4]